MVISNFKMKIETENRHAPFREREATFGASAIFNLFQIKSIWSNAGEE